MVRVRVRLGLERRSSSRRQGPLGKDGNESMAS